jgi:hypothetical protein
MVDSCQIFKKAFFMEILPDGSALRQPKTCREQASRLAGDRQAWNGVSL